MSNVLCWVFKIIDYVCFFKFLYGIRMGFKIEVDMGFRVS